MKIFHHRAFVFLMGFALSFTAFGAEVRLSLAERFFPERMEFSVRQAEADAVLSWSISGDSGQVGFNVFRSSNMAPEGERINPAFLYDDQAFGGTYEYRDSPPADAGRLVYQMELVFTDGSRIRSSPVALEFLPTRPTARSADDRPRFRTSSFAVPSNLAKTTAAEIRQVEGLRSQNVGRRIKITVKDEGLYSLSADTLASKFGATVDEVKAWISQDFLRLSSQGEKCSWIPASDNAGLSFYNPGYETLYTFHNVFWLERESAGLVIPPVQGDPPAGALTPNSFVHTSFFEEQKRQEFARFYPNLEDYWFWVLMQAGSPASNLVFEVDRIDASGPDAQLDLRLQGGSNSGASNEHHVVVSLNGTVIGHAIWAQNLPYTNRFAVPLSVLANGTNTLSLRAVLDAGISYSSVYLDHFSLTYRMRPEAAGDTLRIPPVETTEQRISGFSSADIRVTEILDAHRIRAVENVRIEAEAGGKFSASFVAATNGNRGYAAVAPPGARAPIRVEGIPTSSLRATTNRVDYLLITHPILEAQTRRLADFRASQDAELQTRIVLIDDIYDEFSRGIETPEAIQRFLAYVHSHWRQKPEYVLFAGAGSFDYKNYLGYSDNLVTCLRVDTPYGLYSSDNTLADVVGQDGVPEFSIGRISATTLAVMSNVVDKILVHETNPARPQVVLLAADNPDPAAGDFWSSANSMTNFFPALYGFVKVYLDPNETNVAQAKISFRASFNAGVSMMLYFGHASWNRLSTSGLWRLEDMPSLSNSTHLPIVLPMACWPNRFEFPGYSYIGEEFVLADHRGGVASWGPSGDSLNSLAQSYCEYFLVEFRNEPSLRLGTLARLAAQRARPAMPRFMIDEMTLLGDPMTTVDAP